MASFTLAAVTPRSTLPVQHLPSLRLSSFASSFLENASTPRAALRSNYLPSSRLTSTSSSMGSSPSAVASSAATAYDFEVENVKGEKVPLGNFKGKVSLIVNVASQCGLTNSNYKGLQELYNKYKDQGFEILAFPCNQFGGQEPGSNAEIENFACSRYKATFPIFSKIDVNGPNTAPLYEFLKSKKGGGFLGNDIKWNFGKFLVDKEGNVVERYAPTTGPEAIEGDVKKLLAA